MPSEYVRRSWRITKNFRTLDDLEFLQQRQKHIQRAWVADQNRDTLTINAVFRNGVKDEHARRIMTAIWKCSPFNLTITISYDTKPPTFAPKPTSVHSKLVNKNLANGYNYYQIISSPLSNNVDAYLIYRYSQYYLSLIKRPPQVLVIYDQEKEIRPISKDCYFFRYKWNNYQGQKCVVFSYHNHSYLHSPSGRDLIDGILYDYGTRPIYVTNVIIMTTELTDHLYNLADYICTLGIYGTKTGILDNLYQLPEVFTNLRLPTYDVKDFMDQYQPIPQS